MRKLIMLAALLLTALPVRAQSTKLQLGLYWGSFSGAQVTNATTTLANSKGVALATMEGAWPTVTQPLAFDLYTIHVVAPAANGHPALDYTVILPIASAVPGTTFKITGYTARIAFNADGKTGTLQASVGATF